MANFPVSIGLVPSCKQANVTGGGELPVKWGKLVFRRWKHWVHGLVVWVLLELS
ncbi:hypothetical protein Z948_168 [Sulfitobacter donghicola DSW-25 = KCTC 12864 = JCM 14565]|nr:hypothetical protein Z948_168 [Sulfitobacter donghicola DSW-25 = KCTC 12864 = JCM 14565]